MHNQGDESAKAKPEILSSGLSPFLPGARKNWKG